MKSEKFMSSYYNSNTSPWQNCLWFRACFDSQRCRNHLLIVYEAQSKSFKHRY